MATRTKPDNEEPRAGDGALYSVIVEDGSTLPSRDPDLPEEQLLYLYRTMVLVREFDRRMLMLQRQGRIGFYGPILGQEAATVGSVAAMEDRDWIFPALREGAAAMMRGMSLSETIAQLMGNSADRAKGRQMPCHYTYAEGHYYGMSSVVGTQITHAVGAALAAKIRGDDVVVLGYLGDGATSTNDFHAGMNFAGVWQAPVVLFCQNNQWAISVPLGMQSASETLAQKGKAYGIPYARVDGNDILAVHSVTAEATARARDGGGPTFIEAVTYRRLGHSSSDDPSRYRDEAEVERWEQRDPVDRFRLYLEKRQLWNSEQNTALLAEIAANVNEAIAEVENAGPPAPETLFADVYDQPTPAQVEQLDSLLEILDERRD